MNGIFVVLASGETRRLAISDDANPEQLLEAFVSDNNPFGGAWLETDDGQYLRKSAVVRVFLQSDSDSSQPGTTQPGFVKTNRPYNVS